MNSSNPLQMLMQLGQMQQQTNPMQQMMNMGTSTQQPIDQQRFTMAATRLDKQSLANLVKQARQQGISEAEIEAGLNFLLKLK